MSYYQKSKGVQNDGLLGGTEYAVLIRNVRVSADAVIKRGMVLASETTDGEYSLASKDDKDKVLAVAKEDFEATSTQNVTQAYTSGRFNGEKLIVESETRLTDLIEPLRKVNILVTSMAKWRE